MIKNTAASFMAVSLNTRLHLSTCLSNCEVMIENKVYNNGPFFIGNVVAHLTYSTSLSAPPPKTVAIVTINTGSTDTKALLILILKINRHLIKQKDKELRQAGTTHKETE